MKRLAIMLTVALAFAPLLTACGDYSDGDRIGVIQKFSHKGFLVKTWEGDMLLGGIVSHDSSTVDSGGNVHTSVTMGTNVWSFTVENPALVEQVQHYMNAGIPVRVTYHQELMASPFRTETAGNYFLVGVTPIQ